MPVTIKSVQMKYKDQYDNYVGVDAVSDFTTEQKLEAINTAGTTQTGAVNSAGETQLAAVNGAGLTQITNINNRAAEIENSWPSDYSELTEDVEDLKSAINANEDGDLLQSDRSFDFTAGTILGAETFGFYFDRPVYGVYFRPYTSATSPTVTYKRYVANEGMTDGSTDYTLVETKEVPSYASVYFSDLKENEFIIVTYSSGKGYYTSSNSPYRAKLMYFNASDEIKLLTNYVYSGVIQFIEPDDGTDSSDICELSKSEENTSILISNEYTNTASANVDDVNPGGVGFKFAEDFFSVDITPTFETNSGSYKLVEARINSSNSITEILSERSCNVGEAVRLYNVTTDKVYVITQNCNASGARNRVKYTVYESTGISTWILLYGRVKTGQTPSSTFTYGIGGTIVTNQIVKTLPEYITDLTVTSSETKSLETVIGGVTGNAWGLMFTRNIYRIKIKPTAYIKSGSATTGSYFYVRKCKVAEGKIASIGCAKRVAAGAWLDLYDVREDDLFLFISAHNTSNASCNLGYSDNMVGVPIKFAYVPTKYAVGDTVSFLSGKGFTADYMIYTVEQNKNTTGYNGKTVYAFGDSRTWYDGQTYGSGTKSEWTGKTCIGYQKTIEKMLGCNIVTYGYNGKNSEYICGKIKEKDFTGVYAVILDGGVNDYIVGNTAIGELVPIGSTFDTNSVYGAWQSAIEYILTSNPLCKIIINTPFVCWNANGMLPENIAMVKKNIADLYSLPCNDLYHYSGINLVNRDTFYVDDYTLSNQWRLHLNNIGNAWIGERMAKFIAEH